MATVVKGKKRGKVLPFSQLTTNGSVKNLGNPRGGIVPNKNYEKRDMTPYSKYIPLFYVMQGYDLLEKMPFKGTSIDYSFISYFWPHLLTNEKNWEVCKEKINTHPLRDLIWNAAIRRDSTELNKETITKSAYKIINDFISMDCPMGLPAHGYLYRKTDTQYYFSKTDYVLKSFSFRSYSGKVAPYSLWINDGRQHNPHILMCINAEDWAYQRIHLMLHQEVDISKVFVLVDNRVDGTFPFSAFKGFYKEMLEPELKKLACPVFKVPFDYIEQNCFVQDFELKEANIFKRKNVVSSLIDGFYKTYGEKQKIEKLFIDTSIYGTSTDNIRVTEEMIAAFA